MTKLRITTEVVGENDKTKGQKVEMTLEEHLSEVEQRLQMRKMLNLVRMLMRNCLRTAVGHDVLGWDGPDLGELLTRMDPEARPSLHKMVRLRYLGYEAELQEETRACGEELEEA